MPRPAPVAGEPDTGPPDTAAPVPVASDDDAGGLHCDVTEELRQQRELTALRLATVASGEAIFMTDPQGIFTSVNPAFCALYGWQPAELIGKKTPRVIKSGVVPDEVYVQFWQTILSGKAVTGEIVNKRRDGSLVTVHGSANPIQDEAGEIVGFFAIQTDISERKRAEEERRKLAAVVEQSSDTAIVFDTEFNITFVNRAFEEATGFGRDEVLGRSIWQLRTGDQDDAFYHDIIACLKSGKGWRGRMTNRHRDGRALEREVNIRLLRDEAAVVTGYVSMARDISKEVDLSEQLRQAQKMEAVGQLAGGIAHDFNNILSVILGTSDLALEEMPKLDPAYEDLCIIRDSARRASALTRQLLTFSRRDVAAPIQVDLDALVAGLQDLLRRSLGETVTISLRLDAAPWTVFADPGGLEQVLLNLAVNARDAMAGAGTLRIETDKLQLDPDTADDLIGLSAGKHLRLKVCDDGAGMSRQVAERVFDPFFTTKGVGQGTGLGLSMVYGIVKRAGGLVRVDSELGRGTTFEVLLPACTQSARSGVHTTGRPPRSGSSRTILLVEDEDGVRRLVVRVLERNGHVVHTAVDGQHALEVYEALGDAVDLVITDVVMPRMSGHMLAERLRQRRPELPVLFMSGYADVAAPDDLQGPGRAFLAKPFVRDELLKAAEALMAASPKPAR